MASENSASGPFPLVLREARDTRTREGWGQTSHIRIGPSVSTNPQTWPFDSPPYVASFTVRSIVDGKASTHGIVQCG